jgi:glycosyltransferase involved in cell wall biosynthesis
MRKKSAVKAGFQKPAYGIIISMDSLIAISVIIPVYNSGKRLKECLDSVYAQNFSGCYEVILAIDPSTDDSYAIAIDFQKRHSELIILDFSARLGVALSRLEAIKKAKGKYVYFADADDRLAVNCLSRFFFLAEENGADCVNSSFYLVRKGKRGKDRIRRYRYGKDSVLDKQNALKTLLTDVTIRSFMWSKFYRRDLFAERPLIVVKDPQAMFEDVAFNFSLFAHCRKVVTTSEPLYYYRKTDESLTSAKRIDRAQRHLLIFALERHYLDLLAEESLLSLYRKKLWRAWLSLLFDALLDFHNGQRHLGREIAYLHRQFRLLGQKKPLLLEKLPWEQAAIDSLLL